MSENLGLRVLASSTYEDITLQLVKDNSELYYVKFMYMIEAFNVPDLNEILNLRDDSTVPPNCFILFRKGIQSCVSNIGLRIRRGALSKHISSIWKDLRKSEPNLVDLFKETANTAARIFNDRKLRIRIFDSSSME
ncbi:14085_t:CDS:1 [Dentiscutata heterogama]|uniref:14085_t:CDS:1 n=1 Tax=Dentiscutata heterogama TaxID=1316150 RepID=A0ACA9LV20_9GLOM|nr:14085_t:CDS:1 [Dentiscutata heterogama]